MTYVKLLIGLAESILGPSKESKHTELKFLVDLINNILGHQKRQVGLDEVF